MDKNKIHGFMDQKYKQGNRITDGTQSSSIGEK